MDLDTAAPWTPCWGIQYTFVTQESTYVHGVVCYTGMTDQQEDVSGPFKLSVLQNLRETIEKRCGHSKNTLLPVLLHVVWCDVPPSD